MIVMKMVKLACATLLVWGAALVSARADYLGAPLTSGTGYGAGYSQGLPIGPSGTLGEASTGVSASGSWSSAGIIVIGIVPTPVTFSGTVVEYAFQDSVTGLYDFLYQIKNTSASTAEQIGLITGSSYQSYSTTVGWLTSTGEVSAPLASDLTNAGFVFQPPATLIQPNSVGRSGDGTSISWTFSTNNTVPSNDYSAILVVQTNAPTYNLFGTVSGQDTINGNTGPDMIEPAGSASSTPPVPEPTCDMRFTRSWLGRRPRACTASQEGQIVGRLRPTQHRKSKAAQWN